MQSVVGMSGDVHPSTSPRDSGFCYLLVSLSIPYLGNKDFRIKGLQSRSGLVNGLGKLNRAENGNALILVHVGVDRFHEVLDVDLQLHEHVENRNLRLLDGDQARVAVVDHEVGAQALRGVVIHAASTVGDIAHHDHLCVREVTDYIGDGAGIARHYPESRLLHRQSFGKLQTDRFGMRLCDSVDGFVYLKVVVRRKPLDCPVQRLVVQNLVRNGVSSNYSPLRHSLLGDAVIRIGGIIGIELFCVDPGVKGEIDFIRQKKRILQSSKEQ